MSGIIEDVIKRKNREFKDRVVKLEADLALEKSINKWQDIVRGVGGDRAARDCALCKLHSSGFGCGECIIKKDTGFNGCKGTPYVEFLEHHDAEHKQPYEVWERDGREVQCEKCVVLSVRVLDNLKRLRHFGERMTATEAQARNRHGLFDARTHTPPTVFDTA